MAAKSRSRDTCAAVPARSTSAVGSAISWPNTAVETSRSSRSPMRASALCRRARKTSSIARASAAPSASLGSTAGARPATTVSNTTMVKTGTPRPSSVTMAEMDSSDGASGAKRRATVPIQLPRGRGAAAGPAV